jgi:hypothetical protein
MIRTWQLAILAVGCSAGEPEEESQCFVERTVEPFTRTCLPRSLAPELDPESPDYGRLPCVVIDAGPAGTPSCDCARPGFAPASDAQVALARETLDAQLLCEGGCCDNLCFCELLQFSGAALDYCQGREPDYLPGPLPNGWCYVEPGVGLGDASTVANCPATQQRLIRFLPDDALMNHHTALFACID